MKVNEIPFALFMILVLGLPKFAHAEEQAVPADRQQEVLDQVLQKLNEQGREIVRLRTELGNALQQNSYPPLPATLSVVSQPENSTQDNTTGRASIAPQVNGSASVSAAALSKEEFSDSGQNSDAALNLTTLQSDFNEGIVIESNDVAMKIGGYVKVDVIHDFQPVGNEYKFDTTSILVNSVPRENSRIHARQSRLSFDTRWNTDHGTIRAYIEGDFFGADNAFQLRHAYGEYENFIVGQTWSTFANTRALPPTLDNEGSASVINRRQGQVRWTQKILMEGLSYSLALEDPRVLITETISMQDVETFTESPDLVMRLRYHTPASSLQVSSVFRELGLLKDQGARIEDTAWGFNLSGSHHFTERDEGYAQITFGEGIGSYNNIPDVVSDGVSQGDLLPVFGWMAGLSHRWTERLQSNVVYSVNKLNSPSYQPGEELHMNSYFATNLIWSPATNYFMGMEYLYGTRENVNGDDAEAHRLQTSFGFYLP